MSRQREPSPDTQIVVVPAAIWTLSLDAPHTARILQGELGDGPEPLP
jgi:hypothetical protein